MKRNISAALGLGMSISLSMVAANPEQVRLWPSGAPHQNGLETVAPTGDNDFLSGVNEAIMTIYPAQNFNGTAIVMCPGGGYAGVALNHEGHDMADWFNDQGITYAVLQYRMPNGNYEVPIEDAEQAMRIMRSMMPKGIWIGIGGASAGGHLAASLATLYSDREVRPDFQVLFYPVITMGQSTHGGSRKNLLGEDPDSSMIVKFSLDRQVNNETPPAFLILSADDRAVPPVNSIDYFNALNTNGVPAAMHIYPTGGHGWGFSDTTFKELWQLELSSWLNGLKKD